METREDIENQIRKFRQLAAQIDEESAGRLRARADELELRLQKPKEKPDG
jgi:hypothetical protein